MPRYGQIDGKYGGQLATSELREPIYMLSLTKYLVAAYDDPCGECSLGDFEADGRFAPIHVLTAVGAVICFSADVVAGSDGWDRVAVVRYPARRSFIEMSARQDFQLWHIHKQSWVDRMNVLGVLPLTGLPNPSCTGRSLLEIWDGPVPEPVTGGATTMFDVEGTVVGDGRQWSGARLTDIEQGTALPLQPPQPYYQAMLLKPTIERWLWPS